MATTIKLSERSKRAAIGHILELMAYWRISPDELAETRARSSSSEPVYQRVVKYRHPVHGMTWDGTGGQPEWLKDALLKEGYRPEELRPEGTPPTSSK